MCYSLKLSVTVSGDIGRETKPHSWPTKMSIELFSAEARLMDIFSWKLELYYKSLETCAIKLLQRRPSVQSSSSVVHNSYLTLTPPCGVSANRKIWFGCCFIFSMARLWAMKYDCVESYQTAIVVRTTLVGLIASSRVLFHPQFCSTDSFYPIVV